MKIRLINIFFVVIGISIGIILSLQIQAKPIRLGSFPLDQVELQKSLLKTFSEEQDELKRKFGVIESKLEEAKAIITKHSSKQTVQILKHLRNFTGFESVHGNGIAINLIDNPSVARLDFSSLNDDFVQATDLRDLVNALFLKDANAISINGKRVTPLTSIEAVFDTILIDNLQITPPFIVQAVGDPEALKEALISLDKRKIQFFIDAPVYLEIAPLQNPRSLRFLTRYPL